LPSCQRREGDVLGRPTTETRTQIYRMLSGFTAFDCHTHLETVADDPVDILSHAAESVVTPPRRFQ
jgi:hypothetical protein